MPLEPIFGPLDQHPDAWALKRYYLFSGDPDDAVRHAEEAISRLRTIKCGVGVTIRNSPSMMPSIRAQRLVIAHLAEDALACPKLPANLRQDLRRLLAIFAYAQAEPDLTPRGAGVNLAANHLLENRMLALAYFAPMLPDYPRYDYWMGQLLECVRFRLASQTAPCGTWFSSPVLQVYCPTRVLNIATIALRNAGREDLWKRRWQDATLRYLANLTVPDARFKGWRILAGVCGRPNRMESIWGQGMAAAADGDPKFAGWLRYVFRLAKGGTGLARPAGGKRPVYVDEDIGAAYSFYYLPDVQENPQPMGTEFFPAFGVVFRAHFGSPDETAMILRAGMNWSNGTQDYSAVILYGKGAPLSPGIASVRPVRAPNGCRSIHYNQVKVGRRDLPELFGRVDCTVADYGFGDNADYAVADRYYPPELLADGKGEMRWRRHVLFLKGRDPPGPNYFVMRDSFPQGQGRDTWWNWRNLDGPERVQIKGNVVEMRTEHGAGTHFWFTPGAKRTPRIVATYDAASVDGAAPKETKTVVEMPGKADEGYFYVVYPHKDAEKPPDSSPR